MLVFVSYTLGWSLDSVGMWILSFALPFIVTMISYPMSLRLGIYRSFFRLCRVRQRVRVFSLRASHTIYIICRFVFVMFCKRVAVIILKYPFGSNLAVDSFFSVQRFVSRP